MSSKPSSEPVYRNRYSTDKLNYYKSLGHRHLEAIEENSTSYSDSSDDFPSPSPPKQKNKEEKESKYSMEQVKIMEKRLKDLERMVRK